MEHTQQNEKFQKTGTYIPCIASPKEIKTDKQQLLSLACLADCEILYLITIKIKGEECELTLHITSPP
jgi:hypothetical protein